MPDPIFDRLVRMVEQSGTPFVLHEHQAMKTMADAGQYLPFDVAPTIYCGIGLPDRTLEIAPDDLVRLSGGLSGCFSK